MLMPLSARGPGEQTDRGGAKLALECGYTAARSGGSLFNIDVWLKKAIENDLCPGPRLARLPALDGAFGDACAVVPAAGP